MKVRSCQEKKVFYGFAAKSAAQEKAEIQKSLDDLSAASKVSTSRKEVKISKVADEASTSSQSVPKSSGTSTSSQNISTSRKESSGTLTSSQNISSSRKVRAVSPDVSDVISAVANVLSAFTAYISAVTVAATTVDVLSQTATASLCPSLQHVYTLNGYYKTICRIHVGFNSSSAKDYCESGGLRLGQVITYDDYVGMHQGAFGVVGIFSSGSFHVDGYKVWNGSWTIGDQPVYKSVAPSGNGENAKA